MSSWCHDHLRPAETCWECHPNHSTLRNWRLLVLHIPQGHDAPQPGREHLVTVSELSESQVDSATGAYRDNRPALALHSQKRGAGAGYWRCNCLGCLAACWAEYEKSRSRSLHHWWSGEVRPSLYDPANGVSLREAQIVERDYVRLMEDFRNLGF